MVLSGACRGPGVLHSSLSSSIGPYDQLVPTGVRTPVSRSRPSVNAYLRVALRARHSGALSSALQACRLMVAVSSLHLLRDDSLSTGPPYGLVSQGCCERDPGPQHAPFSIVGGIIRGDGRGGNIEALADRPDAGFYFLRPRAPLGRELVGWV